ncbi:hypothetical protein X805_14670 [Sphaerotilus natans subsp. natans DSM 6575]|uniref:Uncharacterized protein n=1 Tax=Sphaerotilus natans subsp. natans DSM 6575 TaxID=1286631 RepID=A0A059KPA8_9BURK|nr:hypothetical protein X805_14670 [Sphaerotilus natans subsp. natans DSM 6575]
MRNPLLIIPAPCDLRAARNPIVPLQRKNSLQVHHHEQHS